MVGELHKRGYQRLRVMPYFGPTGAWRCSIAPATLFYRNHGAIHIERAGPVAQEVTMVARHSGAAGNHYFDWHDTTTDTARLLADKFVERFLLLADSGKGWDYPYAGWYLRLLGYAEQGWLPYVFAEYTATSFQQLHLDDRRPADWQRPDQEPPILPLPPPGALQKDYGAAG
jgi:hypothetical protein